MGGGGGEKTLDSGCWVFDVGCWGLGIRHWGLGIDVRCWTLLRPTEACVDYGRGAKAGMLVGGGEYSGF